MVGSTRLSNASACLEKLGATELECRTRGRGSHWKVRQAAGDGSDRA